MMSQVDEVARTVRICLTVPLDAPRLLMLELAEKVMYQVPIRAVAGVLTTQLRVNTENG